MHKHSPICLCQATQVTADRSDRFKQTQPVAWVLVGNPQAKLKALFSRDGAWHWALKVISGCCNMVPGNPRSTRVCCSTETPQTHHVFVQPWARPPNKEMHPAPTAVSQVGPYLILPYSVFCLLQNSEFLWGWRQHNMLQLLITAHSITVSLCVMKSSPALTPISGTDPLLQVSADALHFILLPSLFSSLFQRLWEAFEKTTALCFATAAFRVNYFGLLALLQNNKHDNKSRQKRKRMMLEVCHLCAASYQLNYSYRNESWGFQNLQGMKEHSPGRAIKDLHSYFQHSH